jgi:hypothetical protein
MASRLAAIVVDLNLLFASDEESRDFEFDTPDIMHLVVVVHTRNKHTIDSFSRRDVVMLVFPLALVTAVHSDARFPVFKILFKDADFNPAMHSVEQSTNSFEVSFQDLDSNNSVLTSLYV